MKRLLLLFALALSGCFASTTSEPLADPPEDRLGGPELEPGGGDAPAVPVPAEFTHQVTTEAVDAPVAVSEATALPPLAIHRDRLYVPVAEEVCDGRFFDLHWSGRIDYPGDPDERPPEVALTLGESSTPVAFCQDGPFGTFVVFDLSPIRDAVFPFTAHRQARKSVQLTLAGFDPIEYAVSREWCDAGEGSGFRMVAENQQQVSLYPVLPEVYARDFRRVTPLPQDHSESVFGPTVRIEGDTLFLTVNTSAGCSSNHQGLFVETVAFSPEGGAVDLTLTQAACDPANCLGGRPDDAVQFDLTPLRRMFEAQTGRTSGTISIDVGNTSRLGPSLYAF